MEKALSHYGVLGMKWGVRKDEQKSRTNPNYSSQQQKRDKQIYGRGGVKRINKSMNKGDSISTARGVEKLRRDKALNTNKYARQAGKATGAAVGAGAGLLAAHAIKKGLQTQAGMRIVSKFTGGNNAASQLISQIISTPAVNVALAAALAKVGNMAAGDIGVKINMRARGYDPRRR